MAKEIEEALVRPLGEVLARLGEGVAEAQRALDLQAIATRTLIENDPVLRESGLSETWYHMPEVSLELKLGLTLSRETETRQGRPVISRLKLLAIPHNGSSQAKQGLTIEGTSVLKARIVSIPPPGRTEA